MIDPIVHSLEPITLVGGGDATPQDLQEALTLAPTCVAADGGAALAVAEGVELAAVIGDFDSLSAEVRAHVPQAKQHRISEQDSTDFEKALLRVDAPVVVGVGFTGGRMDHQLAAFHVLLRFPARPCVLIGAQEVILLAPPAIDLPTQVGEVVSLFPMQAVQGRSTGLEWPIDGLAFDPAMKIGTSNHATGPCHIEMDAPGMLMILPRRLMQPVVEALLTPDVLRWPAHE